MSLRLLMNICLWGSVFLLSTEAAKCAGRWATSYLCAGANGKRSYESDRPPSLSTLFKRYEGASDLGTEQDEVAAADDVANAPGLLKFAEAMSKLDYLWKHAVRQRRSSDGSENQAPDST